MARGETAAATEAGKSSSSGRSALSSAPSKKFSTNRGANGPNWISLDRRRADLFCGEWDHRDSLADRATYIRAYDAAAKTGEPHFIVKPPPPPDIGTGTAKQRVWEPAPMARDLSGVKPYSIY